MPRHPDELVSPLIWDAKGPKPTLDLFGVVDMHGGVFALDGIDLQPFDLLAVDGAEVAFDEGLRDAGVPSTPGDETPVRGILPDDVL